MHLAEERTSQGLVAQMVAVDLSMNTTFEVVVVVAGERKMLLVEGRCQNSSSLLPMVDQLHWAEMAALMLGETIGRVGRTGRYWRQEIPCHSSHTTADRIGKSCSFSPPAYDRSSEQQ